jgi:hypothetical protein
VISSRVSGGKARKDFSFKTFNLVAGESLFFHRCVSSYEAHVFVAFGECVCVCMKEAAGIGERETCLSKKEVYNDLFMKVTL